ncbi:hypothetical protein ACLB2K_046880 [Fragaria x ananassa]
MQAFLAGFWVRVSSNTKTAALLASLHVRFCLQEKKATPGRRGRRWNTSPETLREKIQKKGIKDSGTIQGKKDKGIEQEEERNSTHCCYSRHRILPETEEHSEAPLNSISIELGCMSDICTGFCRVEEEKDFGGGLAAWGGRNRTEGGGEDGCSGERGGERERDGSTLEIGFRPRRVHMRAASYAIKDNCSVIQPRFIRSSHPLVPLCGLFFFTPREVSFVCEVISPLSIFYAKSVHFACISPPYLKLHFYTKSITLRRQASFSACKLILLEGSQLHIESSPLTSLSPSIPREVSCPCKLVQLAYLFCRDITSKSIILGSLV